ncbi:3-hydroxyacyl-CoA dehydrogenase [Ruminococcus sp.]|uniref:3-hydroxyacyl-CoA dehydrogenase n=1 Tax=Ruminococcus sp. TaxID=41978 RepID=UPI0026006991|nr:3-hydroxyacyl-CoA dehydrogenase [Ruminococcus sp.]
MNKIMIAGGGVLGSQIAFQCAYVGIETTLWLRSEESVQRTKKKLEALKENYIRTIEACKSGKTNYLGALDAVGSKFNEADFDLYHKKVENIMDNIKFETELQKAVSNQNFIIESISENIDIKKEFYSNLNKYADRNAIIATNTSSFLPSDFKDLIDNSERFIAVHFANNIWIANIVEIMGHKITSEETVQKAIEFACKINMIPSVINKEQKGYILNSLLIPFLLSALKLWAGDVASYSDIDKTWKLSTGSKHGAFEMMDTIGINTVYAVVMTLPSAIQKGTIENLIANKLHEMIESGSNFYC